MNRRIHDPRARRPEDRRDTWPTAGRRAIHLELPATLSLAYDPSGYAARLRGIGFRISDFGFEIREASLLGAAGTIGRSPMTLPTNQVLVTGALGWLGSRLDILPTGDLLACKVLIGIASLRRYPIQLSGWPLHQVRTSSREHSRRQTDP
ncbi:MAG: hypothetical protein ABSF95_17935 [Verrucomicrobiota bacterium]|jgi:hypothetical protein